MIVTVAIDASQSKIRDRNRTEQVFTKNKFHGTIGYAERKA